MAPFPHPASDNQTLWYEPERISQPSFYTNLIVGYAGVGRVRWT